MGTTSSLYFNFKVKRRAEFNSEREYIFYLTEFIKTEYLNDSIFLNERENIPINAKYQKFILGNRLSYKQFKQDNIESLIFLFLMIDRESVFGKDIFSYVSPDQIVIALFKVLSIISNRELGNDVRFYTIEKINDKELTLFATEYLFKNGVRRIRFDKEGNIVVFNGNEHIRENNFSQEINIKIKGKRCIEFIERLSKIMRVEK